MLQKKNNFQNIRVLALMNAFSQGKSGGDVAFIQIFKRLAIEDLTVVTSFLGERLCRESGLAAKFLISTSEKKIGNIYFIYFVRTVCATLFIFRFKPDLIYSSSDALPDVLPVFLYKVFNQNVRWIVKRYHDISKNRLISFLMQRMSLFLIRRANLLIQSGKFGFDFDLIDRVSPAKEKFEAVFLARIHTSKGIFDLIEIWKMVTKIFPKARLAIIGRGSEKTVGDLKKMINDAKMQKNIVLFGYLPDNSTYSLIKSAKLFVFPSHEEAFGLVLGEAMICRTPIVAYSLPAYVWCQKYIFTVSPFETNSFAKIIIKLLRDNDERIIHLEKAEKFVHGYTWELATDYERNLIENVYPRKGLEGKFLNKFRRLFCYFFSM